MREPIADIGKRGHEELMCGAYGRGFGRLVVMFVQAHTTDACLEQQTIQDEAESVLINIGPYKYNKIGSFRLTS